jgi:hypothetical protein
MPEMWEEVRTKTRLYLEGEAMKLAIAALMLASVCAAQDGIPKLPPDLAPIACGKYQHFESGYMRWASETCYDCFQHVPDRCLDDLHTVTEREWVELMARLKALESDAIRCHEDPTGKFIQCDSVVHKEQVDRQEKAAAKGSK